jgi:hypothetical protein
MKIIIKAESTSTFACKVGFPDLFISGIDVKSEMCVALKPMICISSLFHLSYPVRAMSVNYHRPLG